MILTDFRFPENLDRDVTGAALHFCDKARSLSGARLFGYLPEDGTAAVGLQVRLRFYANGDYRSATFQLAPGPGVQAADSFHFFLPFSQGYQKAQNELIEEAHRFWVSFAAIELLECHGRVLGDRDIEELEAMKWKSRYRSLRWAHGPMDLNECFCAELARREIEARDVDSSHSRMEAIAAARGFSAFRKNEDATALDWWHNLASADREDLPEYHVRDLPEALKALFTYRNYLARRSGSKTRAGRVVGKENCLAQALP